MSSRHRWSLLVLLTTAACADAGQPLATEPPVVIDPDIAAEYAANETLRSELEAVIQEIEPFVQYSESGASWRLVDSPQLSPAAAAFAEEAALAYQHNYESGLGIQLQTTLALGMASARGSSLLRIEWQWWGVRVWYSPELITLINIALTQPGMGPNGFASHLVNAGMAARNANVLAVATIGVWRVIAVVNAYSGNRGVYINWSWRVPGPGLFWISAP